MQAGDARLLSDEHFSVDGTLLEAWASMKSFRPKGGAGPRGGGGRNAEEDFRGEKRSNATHESTTDPQARQYRKGKGQEAKLCYLVTGVNAENVADRLPGTRPSCHDEPAVLSDTGRPPHPRQRMTGDRCPNSLSRPAGRKPLRTPATPPPDPMSPGGLAPSEFRKR